MIKAIIKAETFALYDYRQKDFVYGLDYGFFKDGKSVLKREDTIFEFRKEDFSDKSKKDKLASHHRYLAAIAFLTKEKLRNVHLNLDGFKILYNTWMQSRFTPAWMKANEVSDKDSYENAREVYEAIAQKAWIELKMDDANNLLAQNSKIMFISEAEKELLKRSEDLKRQYFPFAAETFDEKGKWQKLGFYPVRPNGSCGFLCLGLNTERILEKKNKNIREMAYDTAMIINTILNCMNICMVFTKHLKKRKD